MTDEGETDSMNQADIDNGLSEQRCARCQQTVPVSDIVQVPGVGQVCQACDNEMMAGDVKGEWDVYFVNAARK